jgi:hypothetical protein
MHVAGTKGAKYNPVKAAERWLEKKVDAKGSL